MEYIEDNEINKANGWKLDEKKVTTSKYSYETDINNELYPKKDMSMKKIMKKTQKKRREEKTRIKYRSTKITTSIKSNKK